MFLFVNLRVIIIIIINKSMIVMMTRNDKTKQNETFFSFSSSFIHYFILRSCFNEMEKINKFPNKHYLVKLVSCVYLLVVFVCLSFNTMRYIYLYSFSFFFFTLTKSLLTHLDELNELIFFSSSFFCSTSFAKNFFLIRMHRREKE